MSNESTKITIPDIDSESGLRLCDDDINIYTQSLRLFTTNIPETLDKIRNVTESNLRDYTARVHGIKGISVYIGAAKAVEAAREMEEMGKKGNLAGILERNEGFIKGIEALIENIKTWLKNNGQ